MRQLLASLTPLALLGLPSPILASPIHAPKPAMSMCLARASREPELYGGSDDKQDPKKDSVETRLLRILKERGILTDAEFEELNKIGAEMRAEEIKTRTDIDTALRDLSTQIREKANGTQASKRG